jgi:hypothetical protein
MQFCFVLLSIACLRQVPHHTHYKAVATVSSKMLIHVYQTTCLQVSHLTHCMAVAAASSRVLKQVYQTTWKTQILIHMAVKSSNLILLLPCLPSLLSPHDM